MRDDLRPIAGNCKPKIDAAFFAKYLSRSDILEINLDGTDPAVQGAIGVGPGFPGYDGIHLPFSDYSQDAVFSSHFEHVGKALREWYRVLKIGGYIVVLVPHKCRHERKSEIPSLFNSDHKRFYTPGSLLAELEEGLPVDGFRIRHLADNDPGFDYTNPPGEPAQSGYEIELVVQKIARPRAAEETRGPDVERSRADLRAGRQAYTPPFSLLLRGLGITERDFSEDRVEVSAAFLRFLISELVRPGPFDSGWYAHHYEDIRAGQSSGAVASLHDHYIEHGYFEHRLPQPLSIDPDWYWRHYRDLTHSYDRGKPDALREHLLRSGWSEGRVGTPDLVKEAERWVEGVRRYGAYASRSVSAKVRKPSSEQRLLRKFESLGWNCEFGLVQKYFNVEPLSLFAFGTLNLDQLLVAIENGFEGLGRPENTSLEMRGREFLVVDTKYGYINHTFLYKGQVEPQQLLRRSCIRMRLLKGKLIRELQAAKKVFVYKQDTASPGDAASRVFGAIRSYARNVLLWVDVADGQRQPGEVTRLADGFYKGYIDRFSPVESAASNISYDIWFEICARMNELLQRSSQ